MAATLLESGTADEAAFVWSKVTLRDWGTAAALALRANRNNDGGSPSMAIDEGEG